MKKTLPVIALIFMAQLWPARGALVHRYSFGDGAAKDLVGKVDGRLIGPGASISGGQLRLVNERATPREKVSCLEFEHPVIPADAKTVSFAVWFTAKDIGGFARVLNFGDSEGTEGTHFIYFTPLTEEGAARVAITGGDVGSKTYIDFDALDNGQPHLVVIVVDGTTRSLRVFADGKEPRPAQLLGDNTLDKVRAVQNWLGRSSFAADPGLTASIDEFRVYDHAISPEEAGKLFEAGPEVLPGTSAPEIAGTWDLAVETAMGPGHPVFVFKQEGETLSGSYRGAFGEAPVTGTLHGTNISFSIKVKAGAGESVITYTGTLDGPTMKGSVKLGTFAEGTFTGKKQSK
jgi:hypothetical protein